MSNLVENPILNSAFEAPTSAIREAAVDSGMMTMQETGIRKVLAGVTTPAEILRVTGDEALMSY